MKRTWVFALVGVAVLAASVLLATALGAVSFSLGRTLAILLGTGESAGWERTVVLLVRLPRVLVGALAGGGLAVAGAAMQGVFRNPMADPGVIGVSGGAALGAVVALYAGPLALAAVWVPLAAFAGAVGCAFLVYAIATSRGRTPVAALLLSGIAVGSVAAALTTFVLSIALSNWELGRQMTSWLMGGLEGRSWTHVAMVAPLVLGGSVLLGAHARELDVLLTGEESALAVGVDVRRIKRNLIVLASLVTAATVAVMGVVGFVGLMVPHMVRLVLGPRHVRLLPACFVAGAVLLVWADLACRWIAPSHDLRLGVVTAMFGGPFFLWLLVRNRHFVQA